MNRRIACASPCFENKFHVIFPLKAKMADDRFKHTLCIKYFRSSNHGLNTFISVITCQKSLIHLFKDSFLCLLERIKKWIFGSSFFFQLQLFENMPHHIFKQNT